MDDYSTSRALPNLNINRHRKNDVTRYNHVYHTKAFKGRYHFDMAKRCRHLRTPLPLHYRNIPGHSRHAALHIAATVPLTASGIAGHCRSDASRSLWELQGE